MSAGPEYLEDYFQKGALFGQKAAQNLWSLQTLFPSIWRSVIFGL